jgi:predicted TIM-barrel fold metal-dependent hydrolase
MPGIDILAQLGAAEWTTTDATRLQHALQRARFDLMGVASRRALAGDMAAGNAEVKALVDSLPQMRGWVVVNPSYPDQSAEEMRRYASSPKWFGAMLHPRLCRQTLASEAVREVLNAYRRFTKPLLVHVPDEHAVRELEVLAREFTQIKFIAAGAGGDDWQDAMLAARRSVNLFLEPFSGGSHRGKLEALLQLLGPHRIMFASNLPDRNPGASLGLLLDSKISDAEKASILSTSAARLFELGRQSTEG